MSLAVYKYFFRASAHRLLVSPVCFVAVIVVFTVVGLRVDRSITDTRLQALIGLAAALLFAVSLTSFTTLERTQALTVVAVATFFEVIGSVWWGVYRYRLANLPFFVPPGHGLVYLAGLRISQFPLLRANPAWFVRAAVGLATLWGIIGLSSVVGRVDVAGAVGAVVLSVALLRGRNPTVYAGVFLFVSFLELYGTALGTWRWTAHVPGFGVPDGNPPSGAASGYVVFDICAVSAAPTLLMWARAAKGFVSSRIGRMLVYPPAVWRLPIARDGRSALPVPPRNR